MPATSIQSPFPIFTDIDGQPLEQGQVWLGTAGNNPISSPITAYWDAALTQVVTQPVTTRGGYPLNGTAVGRLYVNADFSILVRNRRGYDVLSALSATERFDSSLVTFVQAGLGAVTRTAQAKMRDVVSVKDFGAVGDGVADDTVAIQAAVNACLSSGAMLYAPTGVYKLTSQINIPLYNVPVNPSGFVIYGAGRSSRFVINHTGTGFYVTCSPSFTQFKAEFRDLYFTDGTSSPAKIIWNNGAINTMIRDCTFEDATAGFCVVNDNAYGLSLQGCMFQNITGDGAYFAGVANFSTYSFVNSIVDCDFSKLTGIAVTVQGCNAFWVANTVMQECNIGFFANPVSGSTTAFNITFDTCWFERNTTWDIDLESNSSYWCEASIRNCQFAGFAPTYQAHIQLQQKSKITVEGTPSGNQVIVSGANDAAAVLIRATNFVQSGTYAWTSIDPAGNISTDGQVKVGKLYSGIAYNSGRRINTQASAGETAAFIGGANAYALIDNVGGGRSYLSQSVELVIQDMLGNPLTVFDVATKNITISSGNLVIGTVNRAINFSGNGGVVWRCGAGTPEGAVTAPVGSLYTRTDGGAGTTLYIKESGTGNTGWVAK